MKVNVQKKFKQHLIPSNNLEPSSFPILSKCKTVAALMQVILLYDYYKLIEHFKVFRESSPVC